MKSYKYWAFISYSSKDKKWGSWLHKRLENYSIPEDLRGTRLFDGAVLGKNLRPVFRDRDELTGAAELGPAIEHALKNSRFLVVLCSKNSAKSEWVNKEIEDYRKMGGEKRILALILDGEPNASSIDSISDDEECFPPALRYPLEPLAGDLRKEGDGKERGFLKLLAGIAQLDFDQLYKRHERNLQKKRRLLFSMATAIIIALSSLTLFALNQKKQAEINEYRAQKQENIAKNQRRIAEEEKIRAQKAEKIAIRERDIAENASYRANIQLAKNAYKEFDFKEGNRLLFECPARLRCWEWKYLWQENNEYIFNWKCELTDYKYAISRRFKVIATVKDNSITFWHIENKKNLYTLNLPSNVQALQFTPKGNLLYCLTGSDIKIFNTETYSEVAHYSNVDKRINSFNFSPSEGIFYTHNKNEVFAWDSNDLSLKFNLLGHQNNEPEPGISDIAISPDGSRIASCSFDKNIYVWDRFSKKIISSFTAESIPAFLTFSSDSKILYCCFRLSSEIVSLDISNNRMLKSVPVEYGQVTALKSFGKTVVASSSYGYLKVFDEDLNTKRMLKGDSGSTSYISLINENELVSISDEQHIKTWKINSKKGFKGKILLNQKHLFLPSGKIALITHKKETFIHDQTTFKQSGPFFINEEPINMSTDGELLITTKDSKDLIIRDLTSNKILNEFSYGGGTPFIAPGKNDIIIKKEKTISFHDIRNFKKKSNLIIEEWNEDIKSFQGTTNFNFHPDKNLMCFSYYINGDGITYIVDFVKYEVIQKVKGHFISFIRDNILIKGQKRYYLVDSKTFKPIKDFDGDVNLNTPVYFSRSENRLFSNNRGSLYVLDPDTLKTVITIENIYDFDMSKDERFFLLQHENGMVSVFDTLEVKTK